MNVSLTPKMEAWIEEKVASGRYASASEVVREGLRLLEEREWLGNWKLEDLKREIEIGIKAADEGRTVPFDEAAVERIIAAGHRRLAERNQRAKK